MCHAFNVFSSKVPKKVRSLAIGRRNEGYVRALPQQPAKGGKGFSKMNKYLLPAAAFAVCLGSSTAFAQSDTQKTTTTMSSPEGTTQTTTMNTSDGYKQYRRTITTTTHYNAGAFVAPNGYTYSRYELGARMPAVLLSDDNLVLTGYSTYALTAPPSGLTWIRVGNDALLVDRKTGEVVETDYGLFAS
jgi:Ni/Co efflux regulator RcnB